VPDKKQKEFVPGQEVWVRDLDDETHYGHGKVTEIISCLEKVPNSKEKQTVTKVRVKYTVKPNRNRGYYGTSRKQRTLTVEEAQTTLLTSKSRVEIAKADAAIASMEKQITEKERRAIEIREWRDEEIKRTVMEAENLKKKIQKKRAERAQLVQSIRSGGDLKDLPPAPKPPTEQSLVAVNPSLKRMHNIDVGEG